VSVYGGRDMAALQAELGRLLGSEHVLAGDGRGVAHYEQDATSARGLRGRADLVVRPGSAAEVTGVVKLCYEHETPLIARGGGTGLAGGAVPLRGGVVCSLERLRAIRELEPGLWRMYVEAGLRTGEVALLSAGSGGLRAVADRWQRRDERGWSARLQVRRHR